MSLPSIDTVARQSGFSPGSPFGVPRHMRESWDHQVYMDITLMDSTAMEATVDDDVKAFKRNLPVNVEGTPVRIDLMGDSVIEAHKLPEVTNTLMFLRGNQPAPGGLFATEIFGNTPETRRFQFAHINLKRKFFHPYIFEVLCKISRAFQTCASGQYAWKIVGGELKKTTEGEEGYDPTATGLRWLINHFKELKLEKNKSYIHNQYVDIVTGSTDDQLFISKFIVIPVFYRDANLSGSSREIPEINEHYKRIIQLTNALSSSIMTAFSNNTEYQIQDALVAVREYGQMLIQGKRGFMKQYVLGKTTIYAARNVITQPIYSNAKLPRDTLVDMFHTGFPIATCCSMGYPFIEHWILDFITREFEMKTKKPILREKNGQYVVEFVRVGDVISKFNPSYIERKVDQFMETYSKRFEPLMIPLADGTEAPLAFTGNPYSTDPRNKKVPKLANRAMTWTDLLYMACVNSLEFNGKMAYVTRYPMVDYFGSFPTMVRVSSTIQTTPMEVDGTRYPFYPVVVPNASRDDISTMFCDTVVMDNIYLDGIGGDYDGDTTSEKMLFTEEANQEAFDIMTDVTHFISIGGKLVQMIGNEAYLTFYNMTRRDHSA